MKQTDIKDLENLYHVEHTSVNAIKLTIALLDKAMKVLSGIINSQPAGIKKGLKKDTHKKLSKSVEKYFF